MINLAVVWPAGGSVLISREGGREGERVRERDSVYTSPTAGKKTKKQMKMLGINSICISDGFSERD